MRLFFLLFLTAFISFWLGCSESDDGPIPLYPDGLDIGGEGYVLAALLDSGDRFHLREDTLVLHLDSMWTFTNCSLAGIKIEDSLQDSVLTLTIHLVLGTGKSTDCPAPFFRPDTTLYLPIASEWKSAREIRIMGNAVNELFPSDTSAAATIAFKDSVLLRSGSFVYDTVQVYVDSGFGDFYSYPRRTSGNRGILGTVDSISESVYAWRAMASHCRQIHDSCEVIPDTTWPSSWFAEDTALVPVRQACVNDSLVYCLTANWVNDSSALSKTVYDHKDTTWYVSTYYLEKISRCASLNWGDFSATIHLGYTVTFDHEFFIPSKSESGCGPAGLSNWIAVNLQTQEEILDSATTAVLVKQWYLATVGAEGDSL